jgi:hypothetical protein
MTNETKSGETAPVICMDIFEIMAQSSGTNSAQVSGPFTAARDPLAAPLARPWKSEHRASCPAPDAELIALCTEFDDLERESQAMYPDEDTPVVGENGPGDPKDLRFAAIHERQDELLDRICDMRAMTRAGLRARAKMIALWSPELLDIREDSYRYGYWNDHMLTALLRDLLEVPQTTGGTESPT